MDRNTLVLIIGGGMAGISAALWCKRLSLDCILAEELETPGGQLHWIQDTIIDFPGVRLPGRDFATLIQKQATESGIQILTRTRVNSIQLKNNSGVAESSQGRITFSGLILASGLRRRSIPAARDFTSKGGSGIYLTAQPRESFKGENLCIIGGGDGAVENAILLANQWKQIALIHRGSEFRARPALLNKLDSLDNVTRQLNTDVVRFVGEKRVESIRLITKGQSSEHDVKTDAVLIKIGFEPQTDLLDSIDPHPGGKFPVVSDEQMLRVAAGAGNPEGTLWLAGDLCTPKDPSLVVAAAQGCIAARSVERHLRKIS